LKILRRRPAGTLQPGTKKKALLFRNKKKQKNFDSFWATLLSKAARQTSKSFCALFLKSAAYLNV